MKKKCAYCAREKKLTKEHVWPECFLKRRDAVTAHYSVKSKKVHGGDYIIRDVCEECNNIMLSELDGYFCELYDTYFKNIFGYEDELIFEYDFNRLSRVLLKIAYNTSRSGVSDPIILAKTAPFIIGKAAYPKGLIIILDIVSPTAIVAVYNNGIKYKEIPPITYRSALTKLDSPNGHKALGRLVAVNSYYFHIFLPNCSISDSEITIVKKEALRSLNGSLCLNDKNKVKLVMGDRDGLSTQLPQMINEFDQYKKFFNRERKKQGN